MHGGLWVSDLEQGIARDQRRCEAEQSAGEPNAAGSGAERLQAQQAENPIGERTADRGHRQCRRASPLFHQSESAGVLYWIATKGHGDIIAAVLALGADAPIQPPYGGVIEEQSLDGNLENIYESVEPLNVRQFVGDHRLQLFLGKSGESRHGQQHDGTEPANHRRSLQPLALAVTDRPVQTKAALQGVADRKQAGAWGFRLFAALPLEEQESAGATKAEERYP